MMKTFIFIFLATNLLVLSGGVDAEAKARKSLSEVDKKLKLLNKPAAKSIKSEDGDTIDCVDINKQPAFDHPALRNHKIQMKPNFSFSHETSSTKNESSSPATLFQTWQKSGSCPEGTIPIRRIRRRELLRAHSIEHLGREGPKTSSAIFNTTNDKTHPFVYRNDRKLGVTQFPGHSTAFLYTSGLNYGGARGDINVWNPLLDMPNDYTTAQIWLRNGLESIEAGWMINPKLYGDKKTRLFARWTVDGYQKTGCFNLVCPGFVQTSKKIALGAPVSPLSVRGGPQYQIGVRIDHNKGSGSWWLQIGDDVIGYWPESILKNLKQTATTVQWGGDVFSSNIKTTLPHTQTFMGSGFTGTSSQGPRNWALTAYIKKIRIIDDTLQVKYPVSLQTNVDEPECYSAYNYQKAPDIEPVLYFGGPGRNQNCYGDGGGGDDP